MNRIITLVYFILISSLVYFGCSELESNITSVSKLGIHGEGVMNATSPNFHGKYFNQLKFRDCQNCHTKNFQGGLTPVNCADANCHPAIGIHRDSAGAMNPSSPNFHGRYLRTNSLTDCGQCHGANYSGGLSSPSCATCHSAISIHKLGIVDPASPNFHGKDTLAGNFSNCQSCHGVNFTGGISSPSCATCHSAIGVHKTGINDPASQDFHGKYTLPNGFTDCQQCHGQNFEGGNLSPTCVTCHSAINVHKNGINDPGSPNFHGKFLASNQWNLSNCKQCHGSTYSGGTQSPTCLTCHNQTGGPEACNTCHGVFNDPTKIAPNIGSHFAHLYENNVGRNVECNQCHTVPSSFSSVGHIDGSSSAEIIFGSLAKIKTNSPGAFNYNSSLPEFVPNPTYNSSTGSCSNLYCHGHFKNGNTDNSPNFTATSLNCGSCHGDPVTENPLPKTPAQGGSHPAVQNCSFCHADVVSVSGTTYTIIDKQKHINGKLNVFGNEETY